MWFIICLVFYTMASTTDTYLEFTKTRDGKKMNFLIRRLPREHFEDFLQMYFTYFVPEESVHRAVHITSNDHAFEEYKKLVRSDFQKEKTRIDGCYLKNKTADLKLVGGSIMVLNRKDDPETNWNDLKAMVQTQEMKKFFTAVEYMDSMFNVWDTNDMDVYYDDRGISVHGDYRKLGIAGELFKTRAAVCKHAGVPMTGAWMTSYGTQISAARLGWDTIYELGFDDFGKATGLTFKGTPPTCKYMVKNV